MDHLQTPNSPLEEFSHPLFRDDAGDPRPVASILDDAVPLQAASHADVLEYRVETPLRYAECFALLSDGRKVGLRIPRQFVGWSRHDADRSLLFRDQDKLFEVAVEADLLGCAPGCIRAIYHEGTADDRPSLPRRFIGADGELVVLPARLTTS